MSNQQPGSAPNRPSLTRADRDCLIHPLARISECIVIYLYLDWEPEIDHSDPILVYHELNMSYNLLSVDRCISSQVIIPKHVDNKLCPWIPRLRSLPPINRIQECKVWDSFNYRYNFDHQKTKNYPIKTKPNNKGQETHCISVYQVTDQLSQCFFL